MLNQHVDHPREVRAVPVLEELIAGGLRVALCPCGFRIRRRRPPSVTFHRGRKMAVMNQERIVRRRMRVPSEREQHDRAERHRASPEFRETLVGHRKVLHLRSVLRLRDRRNLFVHRNPDVASARRIDVHLRRLAVEVSRFPLPVLPFALVHRHLHRMTIAAGEGFVTIDERLHEVVAGGNVLDASRRPSNHGFVDRDALVRTQSIHIHAEDRPRAVRAVLVALKPRLRLVVVGDE